ncbi:MAG TPA: paraquat-inducible protein A [Vicinamibacterales bacterium]
MNLTGKRPLALALVGVSLLLLLPGIFLPVLTIRGTLTREGIAQVAPMMLEKGLNDETVAVLRSMMNPSVLGFIEATGGDVRTLVIERLGPQIAASLGANVAEIEVYEQTRSIVGAVRRLYEVGSPIPATLILLFSVVVPLGKASLVVGALFMASDRWRHRTLRFVEAIAKWSMADVFVVAILIAYLAIQASTASTTGPEAAPALLAFDARFGAGFYWFAAYCLFSLASQQFTVRLVAQSAPAASATPHGH